MASLDVWYCSSFLNYNHFQRLLLWSYNDPYLQVRMLLKVIKSEDMSCQTKMSWRLILSYHGAHWRIRIICSWQCGHWWTRASDFHHSRHHWTHTWASFFLCVLILHWQTTEMGKHWTLLDLSMNQQWFWAAGSFVQWKRTLFLSEEVGGYASKVVLMFLVSQDLPPGTLRHH